MDPLTDSGLLRLTPGGAWPNTGTVDAHVRAEQVRSVYQQALVAQVLSIAVGGLVAFMLWHVSSHARLVWWLAALTVMTTARAGLVLLYRRRHPPPEQMPRWERDFVLTLGAASLTWGVGGVLIMPPESLLHQAVVYFFLMGIAGGAVASYSAHAAASITSIACLMLPATVWFMLQDVLELRAMAAGGLIYLVASIRATRTFGSFLRQTFALQWELRRAYDTAKEQARTDELTGLNNRRAFTDLGTRALDQALRYQRPLSLVMFDIDHFKRINDSYGHAAGDKVLLAVADTIRSTARLADIPGRLGGEEFAVLLPETGGTEAIRFAERLRNDTAALQVPTEGATISFSCSFGVAASGQDVKTLDELLSRADEALYRAKHQGRNRVSRDISTAEPQP